MADSDKNLPLVSIIIPTYNYGHLITETLNSVINQSYKYWEAIIVDDGSTDNTETIVKNFAQIDSRIIYVKQNNRGVSAARNNGLKLAKGEYIQFLDADDLISPNKLKLQIEYLEKYEQIDICLVKTLFFEDGINDVLYTDLILKNKTVFPMINGHGYNVIAELTQQNLAVIESPMFRKNSLDKVGFFREDMHYLEDWDFWFRFALNKMNFSFLDNELALVFVRSHSVSATKQSNKIRLAEGKLRNLFNDYILNSALLASQKKELINKNNKLLINTFKDIMARTPYSAIKKFIVYYKEMKSTSKFIKSFMKSINLKRKLSRFSQFK